MALDMVVHNPNLFCRCCSNLPSNRSKNINTYGQGREITDDEIKSIDTPIWLVQSVDDPTVKYEEVR